MNKKGFTLVELLAVIVVLAVVMLIATTAVVPMMNRARKNAFITEIQSLIKGAEAYYTYTYFTNSHESLVKSGSDFDIWCVDVSKLKGEYVDLKKDMWGRICLSKDKTDSSFGTKYPLVAISNGEYFYQTIDSDDYTKISLNSISGQEYQLVKEFAAKQLSAEKVKEATSTANYMVDYSCITKYNLYGLIILTKALNGTANFYQTTENSGHKPC